VSAAVELDRPDLLGVLGGMGPLATADFLTKLARATPATTDADHVPTVVWSWPQTPDRVAPIVEGTGESPLPWMAAGVGRLVAAGARAIAIPCNTAHYWYDDLAARCPVPLLHIVDAVAARAPAGPLGIMATRATLAARLFPRRLGRRCIEPTDAELREVIGPGIAAVKRGDTTGWSDALRAVVDRMRAAGATAVVLGCTELPIAIGDLQGCLDPTEALARHCVAWALAARSTPN